MPTGREVVAALRVKTTAAGTIKEMRRVQAVWTATGAVVTQVTKMMALSIGHIAAVGGAFFAVTMLVKDYESALVRAGAIGGLTASQTALLSNKIMESASRYGAASEEMASGVLELTKAGFEFADVMEVIDTITKVNIANNLDYASSAEIGTLVMKAFKVEAADLENHFDKLQYVVNKTLMDMGDFIELLRYAGSTAITAGVEPEKLYAMAGALADVAQRAGIGARGINRMTIEMLKEVDAVQKWSDSLGLNIEILKDGTLNIHEIIQAFSQLGMTEELMLESLERFSIRSARAWLGLMINAEEYFELVEGQKGAANYLNDVVGPQLDTLDKRLQRLKETMKAAFRTPEFLTGIKVAFDGLEESVLELLPALREMVLDLLVQAPKMFNMLFEVIQNLLPILTGGLMPVMQNMAKVLGWLNEKGLLKFIILFMLLRKLTPMFAGTMAIINAVIFKTAMSAQMLATSISGFVGALILLWAIGDRTTAVLGTIAIAIFGIGTAIVALRTVTGDVTSAVKYGLAAASAAASGVAAYAMINASRDDTVRFNARQVERTAGEASAIAGSFQIGTRYAPRTGLAMVHEGEPIGTKAGGVFDRGGTVIIENRGTIYGDEDALKRLIKRVMAEEAEGAYS